MWVFSALLWADFVLVTWCKPTERIFLKVVSSLPWSFLLAFRFQMWHLWQSWQSLAPVEMCTKPYLSCKAIARGVQHNVSGYSLRQRYQLISTLIVVHWGWLLVNTSFQQKQIVAESPSYIFQHWFSILTLQASPWSSRTGCLFQLLVVRQSPRRSGARHCNMPRQRHGQRNSMYVHSNVCVEIYVLYVCIYIYR